MVQVALLSYDQKQNALIKTWVKEFKDFKLEIYKSIEQFEKGLAANSAEVKKFIEGNQAAEAVKLLYRLIIIDLEVILDAKEKPLTWVSIWRSKIDEYGLSNQELPTRVLLIGFDDNAYRPERLQHPLVNDLVIKPLDKLLFMQKMELLIAEKFGEKPSFLFRQPTEMAIEAGKDAIIDEISDFALGLRNPGPLAAGVYAAIHCDVFGSQGRMIARSYQSERHSTHEGEYLVRFSLFGAVPEQISSIRRYLKSHQIPGIRIRRQAELMPMKNETQHRKENILRSIAVIDMDRMTQDDFQSVFREKFKDVEVSSFASYTKLLARFAPLMPNAKPAPPQVDPVAIDQAQAPVVSGDATKDGAEPANVHRPGLPGGRHLEMVVHCNSLELFEFYSVFEDDEFFLDHPASHWIENPEAWTQLILREHADDFQEFTSYVVKAGHGQTLIRMKGENERVYYFTINGESEGNGENKVLRLEFIELPEVDWKKAFAESNGEARSTDTALLNFDAIFIDPSTLRVDLASWMESFANVLIKTGIAKDPAKPLPKIFLLMPERSRVRADGFQTKSVYDVIYKPIDRRMLVNKISALMPELEIVDTSILSSFIATEIPAKMAKRVLMEEISEFGLSIFHRSPFREGVFMRFFSSVFGDNPSGIIGRCSHCDKVEASGNKKEGYLCHFVFFGISEDIQMLIRTWVREYYVQKKASAGG